ncbi:hypothetical protein BV898_12234 [Hypsibius exemplaris]|uniref:HAT C-terminal dimerisation domain-containing protein n=1 Tax=Hypsibius exemplaris TaxID=2072580 RepID=A0A1W0WE48_HYPEX|nr:hypothetical protein BV898_12234 [Hypsibius exemplaris]
MLNSIRKSYDQIEKILRDRNEVHLLPGSKALLEEFSEFLKPFKDATIVLSADTSPTLHLVALCYYKLRRQSNTISVTTSAALRALVDHAKKVVPVKLIVDDIHKVAMFLNPASKHLPVFEDHKKPAIQAMVGARLAKLLKKLEVPISNAVRVKKPSSFDANELLIYAEDTAGTESDDVDSYVKLPPPSSAKSLLQTWEDYKDVAPRLKLLADRILCVPASSTSSERLFSDAGNIFTDRRTSLGADKLDDLFLKWNLTFQE